MPSTRFIAASALLIGALVGLPATASAERRRLAEGDDSGRAALVGERVRVRAELERANADVDALKRSGRGLREDYRLRERLADAEALARRLTELDARLGGAAPSGARGPGAEPSVSPADGPAELDAKADILADQAQRLAARGDQLLGRARDLRARQTLRRRVGQMERDPFSPLEGSKRRAMTGGVPVVGAGGTLAVGKAPPTLTGMGVSNDVGGGTGPAQPAVGAVGPSQASPAPGGGATTTMIAATPGATNAVPSQTPQTAVQPATTTGIAVSAPPTAPSPTSATDATALSVQLRDLLDPTTLAEIQRLETTGGAATRTEALERAGAALKARAERLRQQAATLRANEHADPRAR